MKKTKALFMLFLILAIVFIPLLKVNAHSVELDPNSLISFPIMLSNGKGNITIKNSETGYSLYYQAVEISNTVYSQIQEMSTSGKNELNNIKAMIDALRTEYTNLQTIYDNAYKAYKEKLDSGITGTDLETAKATYETAKINYQNKVTEYNNKVKEYNTKSDEINAKVKQLVPTYIESNWTKTDDRSFSVDLSKFSGEKAFAVWAKLVSSNGTISYDQATYTMSGTKVDEIEVKSVSLDKTTLSITEGNSYTLTATVIPSNATNKLLVWSSDNENIVKVENGKVTGVSKGTTNIVVTTKDGNYTATCKVTVSEKSKTPSTNDDKEKNSNVDNTIAKNKLPNTGNSAFIITSAIIIVSIIGFVTYKKLKKINF